MRAFAKLWKVWIAVILFGVAAYLYFVDYRTEEIKYELTTAQMQTMIAAQRSKLNEDMAYADVQEEIEVAKVDLAASRLDLYKHFPKEMREEDQLMYAVYLETVFGTEIMVPVTTPQLGTPVPAPQLGFDFGEIQAINVLTDSSLILGLELVINYETTYDGFKEMINYLATDSRITSVKSAIMNYDEEKDVMTGYLTLTIYMLESPAVQYTAPDIAVPETGKDNVYAEPADPAKSK